MQNERLDDSGVSQPGALQELARDDSSRKRFLKLVGGAGAASAFGIFLAACGDDEEESAGAGTAGDTKGAKGGKQDIEIANYALTLEYLEADFYDKAVDSGMLKGAALDTAKAFGDNEQEHVEALEALVKQLGGKPAAQPRTKFPLESQDAILELAATVENLGAAAYLGQAGRIRSKEVLAAALSIHTVEARHASALNTVVGRNVTPDGAFAKPASMSTVLEAVKPFIAS